jgi:hypothetical protein
VYIHVRAFAWWLCRACSCSKSGGCLLTWFTLPNNWAQKYARLCSLLAKGLRGDLHDLALGVLKLKTSNQSTNPNKDPTQGTQICI